MPQNNMRPQLAAATTSQHGLIEGLSSLKLTQEQYAQLQAFVQCSNSPSDSSGTSSTPQPSAFFSTTDMPAGMKPSPLVNWILDTRATDHMICSLSYFSTFKPIHNLFITLPTGLKVPATHIGVVKFSSLLTLHDVLFVPTFTFNLISVHKLTTTMPLSISFVGSSCTLQDLVTGK
ncbi:hypothetical protein LINPERPRIM_LOCUS12987 [Linum perenne]